MTLTQPYLNCVYQRNSDGFATIPVAGTVAPGVENVLATFTRLQVGAVQNLAYALPIVQTLPVDKDGNFGGGCRVPGGWYSLAVTAGDTTISVSKVGAGEVFVLFGHSFIQGGHDKSHQLPATDERVITLLDSLDQRNYQFGPLVNKVGPFHGDPDSWGQLGDLLVKRLGVPVLFYGCGYGGSNLQMSLDVINGVTNRTKLPPGTRDPTSRQPLAPLEIVMDNYVSKTGVRAILFEHGYNDRGTDRAMYTAMLKQFFDYVRSRWQKSDLSVILVQEQLTPVTGSLYDVPTAQGVSDFLATYPNVYKGPDMNTPEWFGMFAQHDHLFGPALDLFAGQWADSITAGSFLNKSYPYGPNQLPDVFPAVLYNAPASDIKTVDWVILGLAAMCLVGVFVYHNKRLMWGFLLLGLIALGRLTGKV